MKSNKPKTLLVPFLGFFFCATAVVGQAPDPPSDRVAMKIDMVAWGDPVEGLRLKSGGKDLPVTALSFEYSGAVSYVGSNLLEIYQEFQAAGTGAERSEAADDPPAQEVAGGNLLAELMKRRKEKPGLVALALLPAASKHVTLLIAPAPGGIYQTYVIDDDPAKLPPGQLRIHNQSAIPIAMRCNQAAAKELKPRGSIVVPPVQGSVVYELAYQKDGKWKLQENNILTIESTDQVQLIVLRSDADFFTSGDGSRGGFLQTVVLRRGPDQQ